MGERVICTELDVAILNARKAKQCIAYFGMSKETNRRLAAELDVKVAPHDGITVAYAEAQRG